MEFKTAKCVVIITEATIKSEVIELITERGAKGYTIDTVCGRGARGIRDDDTVLGDYLRNVKIETIVPDDVAANIVSAVIERFFKNYAGVVYMHDVQVVRHEKFGF